MSRDLMEKVSNLRQKNNRRYMRLTENIMRGRSTANHHLTHAQLWRIMEVCAQPDVAAAIRAAKPLNKE